MRSRISFFDSSVLKKNLTRFAPVWALYTLGMLIYHVLLWNGTDRPFNYVRDLADVIPGMAVVNLIYAFICAQLLFGDLYTGRMCNALHALPLRRETWFGTHVLSGLLFSFGPNLILTAMHLTLCSGLWQIPLLWLAAVTMQFVYAFGVAVLAANCVGNRFAMAVVYGLLSAFAILAGWMADTLVIPLMYGMTFREEIFVGLTPWLKMAGFEYLDVQYTYNEYGRIPEWSAVEGWGYTAICALIGVTLLALALHVYRRRPLESAGDFAAFAALRPVILVVYTLGCGVLLHAITSAFFNGDSGVFLILGFIVGYITGLMLLERTVRVFHWKKLLGLGAFLAAFAVAFLLIRLDPAGVTRWVPRAESVKQVSFNTGGGNYYAPVELQEEDQIRDMLEIHRYAIDHPEEQWDSSKTVRLLLRYELESGLAAEREYYLAVEGPMGGLLRHYLSSPAAVLGEMYRYPELLEAAEFGDPDMRITDKETLDSLMEAILADCKAEKLPQDWAFLSKIDRICWVGLEFVHPDTGLRYYQHIQWGVDATNLMDWMERQGITPEKWG